MNEQKFLNSRSGSVAVMGGLTMSVIVLGVAASVSHNQAVQYRIDLQGAVDAATISGARPLDADLSERKAIAEAILKESTLDDIGEIKSTKFDWKDGVFSTEVKADVPTVLGSFLGKKFMEVGVASSAGYEQDGGPQPLEIAFVLDSTNSMNDIGGHFHDAKKAVARMADAAFDGEDSDPNVTATLIPYMDRVKFEQNLAKNWISGSPPAGWDGCLDPRERARGHFPYALDDRPPGRAPFRAAVTANQPHNYGKDHMRCYALAAQPTNSPDLIKERLGDIKKSGTGRFDVGLAWAWRALSPRWRNKWGKPDYPAEYDSARKRIVWITDGYSTAGEYDFGEFAVTGDSASDENGNRPKSPFISQGTGAEILGANMGSVPYFKHVVNLCNRIKRNGIEIEVIMTGENPAAVPYFKRCASGTDQFHLVLNMSEFELAIDKAEGNIGNHVVGKLRIKK